MRQYKVFITLIQVILIVQVSAAGFERSAQPTRIIARSRGGFASSSSDQMWMNPAGITVDSVQHFSLFTSPSPYQLHQLSNSGVIITDRILGLTVSAGIQSMGFSLYRETVGSAAAVLNVNADLRIGCTVNFNYVSIERYGSRLFPSADVGWIYTLNESVSFGVSLRNVIIAGMENDDGPARSLCAGVVFFPQDWIEINADLVKDMRFPPVISGSISLSPIESLTFTVGGTGEGAVLTTGFSVDVEGISFRYGLLSDPVLGSVHSLGVAF